MHPNVRLLAWFSFLLDLRLYGPFAIIYYAQVSGSYAMGMSVFALVQVTSAALEVPTGLVSDNLGRRPTMILGALFSMVAVTAYASASLFELGPATAMLLLGGLLEGASRSLFSGNNAALLYDSLAERGQEDTYHHQFGRLGTMLQAGLATGALLGGIAGYWSLELVFWLSIVPQLVALMLSFRFVEPIHTRPPQANYFDPLQSAFVHLRGNRRLRWLTLAQSISFGFGEANFQFVAAFFRTLWPLWAIGLLRTTAHGIAAVGFWWAGSLIDRFGHYRVLVFSSLFGQGAGWSGVWLANPVSPAIMTAPSFLYGVSQTSKNHLLQQNFTDEQRATLGSIVAFAGSLLFAVAAVSIGAIADAKGPLVAMYSVLFVQAWVIPIYIWLFRH